MRYLYCKEDGTVVQSEDEPTVADMLLADDGDITILRVSEDGSLIEFATNIGFNYADDDEDESGDPVSYDANWREVDTALLKSDHEGGYHE